MIANESRTATLIKISETVDEYGQLTQTECTEDVEVYAKTSSETLTRDARYADVEMIALTASRAPSAGDRLDIGGTVYTVEKTIDARNRLAMYLRRRH